MTKTALLAAAVLAVHCGAAQAAAPGAWSAHFDEVESLCIEASGLREARLAGDAVDFDDRVGYSAAVVVGRHPQPHMKGRRGQVLCLFDKASRAAHVAPADAIIRTAGPGSLLSGTSWRLIDLGGARVLDGVEATLDFAEPGRVTGNGSCNRFFAPLEVAGRSLKVGALGATRMACAEAVSAQEEKYLGALQAAERFVVVGDALSIRSAALGKPLRFVRRRP